MFLIFKINQQYLTLIHHPSQFRIQARPPSNLFLLIPAGIEKSGIAQNRYQTVCIKYPIHELDKFGLFSKKVTGSVKI